MNSTVVDESLSSFKPMYCSREYQASTRLSQQYEKSTPNYGRSLKESLSETAVVVVWPEAELQKGVSTIPSVAMPHGLSTCTNSTHLIMYALW